MIDARPALWSLRAWLYQVSMIWTHRRLNIARGISILVPRSASDAEVACEIRNALVNLYSQGKR